MVLITVRDATAADVPAAAGVLARAFDDYPWTRWSVPADRYRQRLEELQAIYLAHAVSSETSDPRNVALYRRFGFGVISETQVPNGPAVSTMVRKRSAVAQRRSALSEAPTH